MRNIFLPNVRHDPRAQRVGSMTWFGVIFDALLYDNLRKELCKLIFPLTFFFWIHRRFEKPQFSFFLWNDETQASDSVPCNFATRNR